MPSSATPPPIPDAAFQYWSLEPSKFVLDNGLRVMVVERARSLVVELRFVCEGGFAADPSGLIGLAGFAMAMFSDGALRAGNASLAVAQESIGAALRGRVTAEGAVVEISTLAANLDDALTMCVQVLSNPEFTAEDFEAVQMNRLALIAHERLSPFDLSLRVLPPMIHGVDRPYARPLCGSGTEQGVTAVTADNLRGYYAEHLAPERGTLVVTGPHRVAELITMLEDTFGRWRTSPAVEHLPPAPPPPSVAATDPSVRIVDRPHAAQSALVAAVPTVARNSSAFEALMVANAVLAGTFTSRLNMSLRESKGWTYGVRSSVLDARYQGLWLIDCSVRHDRTAEAMTEISREIENLARDRPCSPDELGHAIDSLVARAPAMYETCAQIADSLADVVIYRLPTGYHRELSARLRRLNPGRITKACREILAATALRWMIVGDAAKLIGQLSAGGFGEIKIIPERELP